MVVDAGQSSSLLAVHLACESLRRGECRVAIAGGVNLILHPLHYLRLCAMNMLARGPQCRTFGAGADGFVDGEGVGRHGLRPGGIDCALYAEAKPDTIPLYRFVDPRDGRHFYTTHKYAEFVK